MRVRANRRRPPAIRRRPRCRRKTDQQFIVAKKKRPGIFGALRRFFKSARSLSRDFGVEDLGLRLAVADRDLAGLLGLGNLTHQIDVQQSVLEDRGLDLDVVGKLEHALEGCLLYTSPSPRDGLLSRMPSSA